MRAIVAETENFSEEALLALKNISDVHVEDLTESQLSWAFDSFDIFWFRLRFRLTRAHIEAATRCKFILTAVTGLDHIDLQACKEKGIQVISLRGEKEFLIRVRATAEHTVALALALLRNVPDAIQHTRGGHWQRQPFKGWEIYERRVGILGMGRLGSITAGFFHALGSEVIGYDPVPFDHPHCKAVRSEEELFEKSDLVSIHVNLTTETEHLVNRNLLERMPKGSWLVNTSRGRILESQALIDFLNNGHLRGAACDVIENEYQLDKDSLLNYAQRNPSKLLLTPHIGGNTFDSFRKTEMFLVQKLIERLQL